MAPLRESLVANGVVGLVSGIGVGILLDKSTVSDSRVMRAQAKLHSVTPLRVFWSAAASGSLVVAAMRLVGRALGVARALEGPKPVALGSQFVGGSLLGAGMFVSGTAPGILLAQAGSCMREACYTLPGVVAGSVLFFVVSRGRTSCEVVLPIPELLSASPGSAAFNSSISGVRQMTGSIVQRGQNLAESIGVPFWTASVAMSLLVWGGLVYVERSYPWVHEVDDEDLYAFDEELSIVDHMRMDRETWPADIAGVSLGLMQIPCLVLTGSGLALGAVFVGMAAGSIRAASVPASMAADGARRILSALPAAGADAPAVGAGGRIIAGVFRPAVSAVASVAGSVATLRTPVSWRRFPTPANVFDIAMSVGVIAGAAYSSYASGALARRIAKYRRNNNNNNNKYKHSSSSTSSSSSNASKPSAGGGVRGGSVMTTQVDRSDKSSSGGSSDGDGDGDGGAGAGAGGSGGPSRSFSTASSMSTMSSASEESRARSLSQSLNRSFSRSLSQSLSHSCQQVMSRQLQQQSSFSSSSSSSSSASERGIQVEVVQVEAGVPGSDGSGGDKDTSRSGLFPSWQWDLGFTVAERAWLFVGGAMMGFGTLLADGGVSAHGITGFAQMGLGAMVTTTSMSVAGLTAAAVAPYIPGQRSLKFRRESEIPHGGVE